MVRRRAQEKEVKRTNRFNLNFETIGIAIALVLLVFIAAMMFV